MGRIRLAKTEMVNMLAAISQFQAEYSRLPISPSAVGSSDFTFGTFGTSDAAVGITNASGYQANNSELLAILMDLDKFLDGRATINANHKLNPRNIVCFVAKMTADTNSPGIGPDYVFRDPWGHPYVITIHTNGTVTIWSFGPDGKADPSIKADQGVNKDNILSWQ